MTQEERNIIKILLQNISNTSGDQQEKEILKYKMFMEATNILIDIKLKT